MTTFITFLISIGALLTLSPPVSFLLEINTNAAPYYAPLLLLTSAFTAKKRTRTARCATLFGFIAFFAIAAQLFVTKLPSIQPHEQRGKAFTVLFANVYANNNSIDELDETLREADADIICLFEITPRIKRGLVSLGGYGYRIEHINPTPFGFGAYSRVPLTESSDRSYSGEEPVFLGTASTAHGKLHLIAVHLFPPASSAAVFRDRELFSLASGVARNIGESVIAGGDFNATPYSSFLKEFALQGGLQKVASAALLPRTWDMQSSLARFEIDHAFIKGDIKPVGLSHIQLPGSDHAAVLLKITFN